jgi:hypothetical protein
MYFARSTKALRVASNKPPDLCRVFLETTLGGIQAGFRNWRDHLELGQGLIGLYREGKTVIPLPHAILGATNCALNAQRG